MKPLTTMYQLAKAKAFENGVQIFSDPRTGNTVCGYILPKRELNTIYLSNGFREKTVSKHAKIWESLGWIYERPNFIILVPTADDSEQIRELEDVRTERRQANHFDDVYIGLEVSA